MDSFGGRLREERERHDVPLEEIARSSKIGVGYLEALERDDIDALPGPAFGKLYIRVYGKLLGFDPGPWIEEYDEERWRRVREERLREKARREEREALTGSEHPDTDSPAIEVSPSAADTARDSPAEPAAVDEPREKPEAAVASPAEAGPDPAQAAEQCGPASLADRPVVEDGPGTTSPPPAPTRGRAFRWPAAAALVVSAGALALTVRIFAPSPDTGAVGGPPGSGDPAPAGRPATAAAVAPPSLRSPGPAATTSSEAEPSPGAPEQGDERPAPDGPRAAAPGRLTVSDHGVGTRIVDRHLEGRAERFEEGRIVWFSTRVHGGAPGDRIRHVWLHGGGAVQSIELELGGSHWRTHSSKTLWGPGAWAAEARDPAGRVLARTEFECVPAGGR